MHLTTIDDTFARAEGLADAGNWTAAREAYMHVLALDPSHGDAALQLSYIESLAGRYRAARAWALRAAEGASLMRPSALFELIRRLRTFNELAALQRLADQLLASRDTAQPILVECARQLSNLNDADGALRCAEAAWSRGPRNISTRLVHGQLLAQKGDVDEAEAEFLSVLRRDARVALGWWLLARLRKHSATSNHISQLQAVLRTPGLPAADVALIARALHKELDDIGDFQGAWRALEVLCAARRDTVEYDPQSSRDLVDALIAFRAGGQRGDPDQTDRVPVFIVGMHRSGTTLLEQLLSASPQVRGLGELNDFTGAMRYATDHYCRGTVDATVVARASGVNFDEVGKHYLASVAVRLGKERFFTDKQPSNFLNIGFICRAFPNAKILHLVRDPVETCFSNLREAFSGINEYSYDQEELAYYFLQYRRLMAHWHAVLPGRILDVQYAALTRNTEGVMRMVASFCGIDYADTMSDPRNNKRAVATASGIQVRNGVISRETPKWAPYARNLEPLIRVLRSGGVDVESRWLDRGQA